MVMLPTLFTLLRCISELMGFNRARLTVSAQDTLLVVITAISAVLTGFLCPPFHLLPVLQTAITAVQPEGRSGRLIYFQPLGCPMPVALTSCKQSHRSSASLLN